MDHKDFMLLLFSLITLEKGLLSPPAMNNGICLRALYRSWTGCPVPKTGHFCGTTWTVCMLVPNKNKKQGSLGLSLSLLSKMWWTHPSSHSVECPARLTWSELLLKQLRSMMRAYFNTLFDHLIFICLFRPLSLSGLFFAVLSLSRCPCLHGG